MQQHVANLCPERSTLSRTCALLRHESVEITGGQPDKIVVPSKIQRRPSFFEFLERLHRIRTGLVARKSVRNVSGEKWILISEQSLKPDELGRMKMQQCFPQRALTNRKLLSKLRICQPSGLGEQKLVDPLPMLMKPADECRGIHSAAFFAIRVSLTSVRLVSEWKWLTATLLTGT